MHKYVLIALLVVASAPLLLAKGSARVGGGANRPLGEDDKVGRGKEGGRNKQIGPKAPACRYRTVYDPATPCDPETGFKNVTQELIPPPAATDGGAVNPAGASPPCPPTNIIQKRCRVPGGVRGLRDVKAGGKKQGGGGKKMKAVRKGGKNKGGNPEALTTLTPPGEEEAEQVAPVVPEVPPVEGAGAGAGGKNSACKYKKSSKGECDPVTNKKTVTLELKKGKKTPATCPPTKTYVKDCRPKAVRPNRKGPKFF